jgi:hypothetical protein
MGGLGEAVDAAYLILELAKPEGKDETRKSVSAIQVLALINRFKSASVD